jgi:hypothetical protein
VRLHHAKGLLDSGVERASHAFGDMAAQSPEATRHGAPCLTGTPVDALAHLERRLLQKFQILLRGVVGRLERLRLRR